jgi:PAS domain S-box-containing protein
MNRAIYIRRKKTPAHHHPYFDEALRKSQQVLRQFVNTLPVAICIIDRHERTYLDVNDHFAEISGMKRCEVLEKRSQDFPFGFGEVNLNKIMERLQVGQPVDHMEIQFTARGKPIRGFVHAEWVEYAGRECILVTFLQTKLSESHPDKPSQDNCLAIAGDIGRSLAETVDLDEAHRRISGAIFQMLPDVSSVFVSMFNSGGQSIRVAYASHNNQPLQVEQFAEQRFVNSGSDPQSQSIRLRRPLIVNNLQERMEDPSLNLPSVRAGKATAQSGIYAPMIAKGEVIGIIHVHSIKHNHFQQSDAALLTLISNTAAIALQNIKLAENLEQTNHDLSETYEATIEGWTRALLLRDSITEGHTNRVIGLTVELSKKLGLESSELVHVKRGAQLHDIGKIGIEDKILRKAGPLDEAEWIEMRKHPLYAYELLRPIPRFGEILDIPYCHHEKWDGTGYPRRLSGDEIPLPARIFSIVDVWDALSSNRPYRRAWPQTKVLDYIQAQNNIHFEPVITSAFLELVKGKKSNQRPPGAMMRGTVTTFFMR